MTLLWCLALALLGAHDGLLYLVPALLLAAPLAIRRYPGEEALLALAGRRPRARRPLRAAAGPRPRPGFRLVPAGRSSARDLARRAAPARTLTAIA